MESGSLKFTGLEILRDYLYFLGGGRQVIYNFDSYCVCVGKVNRNHI